jgi:hypothetical protein
MASTCFDVFRQLVLGVLLAFSGFAVAQIPRPVQVGKFQGSIFINTRFG